MILPLFGKSAFTMKKQMPGIGKDSIRLAIFYLYLLTRVSPCHNPKSNSRFELGFDY